MDRLPQDPNSHRIPHGARTPSLGTTLSSGTGMGGTSIGRYQGEEIPGEAGTLVSEVSIGLWSPLPGAVRVGAGEEVEGPHRGRAGVKQDA